MEGLTGPIQFDNGLRSNFKLQLMRIFPESEGGKALSGYWTPKDGLEITDPAAYRRDPPPNVTLTVVTVEVCCCGGHVKIRTSSKNNRYVCIIICLRSSSYLLLLVAWQYRKVKVLRMCFSTIH